MLLSNRWEPASANSASWPNAAYSEVVTESQGVQLLRFFNAENVAAYGGGTKWIPGGIDIRNNTYDRTRKGASFAAQWRSPEESLLAHVAVQPLRVREQLGRIFADRRHRQLADSRRTWCSRLEFARMPALARRPYEFDSRGVFMRGIINEDSDTAGRAPDNPALAHPNGYHDTGHPASGTC